MAKNFKPITKGKVGDIIYPAYNGTNGFWKKDRWDLVLVVDKERNIIKRRFIWDYATAEAILLIQELQSSHNYPCAKSEAEK